MAEKGEELSLGDALTIIRRKWWVVLVVGALLALVTFSYFRRQVPRYQSSTVLLLDLRTPARIANAAGQAVGPIDVERLIENEIQFARSSNVRSEMQARLGDAVAIDLSVSASDSDTLTFQARSTDPAQAQLVADTGAAVYQELSKQQTVALYDKALADLDAVLTPIQARLGELAPLTDMAIIDPKIPYDPTLLAERRRLESDLQTNGAKRTSLALAAKLDQGVPSSVISAAALPGEPFAPRSERNAIIGFLAGAILAIGGLFMTDYLDDRLRDRASIAKVAPRLATLAIVPRARRAARSNGSLAGEPGVVGESVRALRASVQFASLSRPLNSVLVTSSKPKEGKSTLAMCLAIAFARNGTRVVLIDADMRKPKVHKNLRLGDNSFGLTTVLQGQATLNQVMRPAPGVENLAVITSGPAPANPADFLASDGGSGGRLSMKHLVDELVANGLMVIVDAPPVLPVVDALTMSRAVDGVLFVVAAGSARERDVSRAFEVLGQAGAQIVGIVVNKLERSGTSYARTYGYSDGKRSGGDEKARPATVPVATAREAEPVLSGTALAVRNHLASARGGAAQGETNPSLVNPLNGRNGSASDAASRAGQEE